MRGIMSWEYFVLGDYVLRGYGPRGLCPFTNQNIWHVQVSSYLSLILFKNNQIHYTKVRCSSQDIITYMLPKSASDWEFVVSFQ